MCHLPEISAPFTKTFSGKLHNIVHGIYRAQRLSYLLRDIQADDIKKASSAKLRARKPLQVIRDNDTRWLSQLYMIRRALKLRRHIELTILKFKQEWEDENRAKRTKQVRKGVKTPLIIRDESQLSENDWGVLQRLEEILTEFETVVKTLEGDGQVRKRKRGFVGSYGNVWDVILGFERLMAKLEKFKAEAEDFPDPEQFRIGINLAWQKMDEYYRSKLSCRLYGQRLTT